MKKSEWFQSIHDRLFAVYGECTCPLHHENSFQLLAAVMLSAQCRDERVNQVTEKLFSLAPTPEKMVELTKETIQEIIHPCGLSGSKSKNLHACAEKILDVFHGEVPQTMEELTSLPGIGRKSANVVLGNSFNIPGFPVDTHVKRVLKRVGIVKTDSPEKIEVEVNKLVNPALWTNFSHLIIQHGRQICKAAKPACNSCVLADICKKKDI